MKSSEETLYEANSDIIEVFKAADTIGWDSLKQISVPRILYIASVLYSFRYPDLENRFSKIYHFALSPRGPIENTIGRSLTFLLSRDYLIADESKNELSLNSEVIDDFDANPHDDSEWFTTVITLLATFGIDKIYEFVIRDPQYHDSVSANSQKELDVSPENLTLRFLERFRNEFETSLPNESAEIDEEEYLSLYFEFVFRRVVDGENLS